MGKKLITERHVTELFQSGQREIVISVDELLAPLARDFATSNRMKISYGSKAESQATCVAPKEALSDIDVKIKTILEKDFSISDEATLESLIHKIKVKIG